MARFSHTLGHETYRFDNLRDVLAKASTSRRLSKR